MFFSDAQGVRIRDVDGNEYLDFTLSQGPLLLGHSHPEVLARVKEEESKGQLYAAQSELELKLARRLTEILPGAELVRFGTSGSDAVHTAIRLARAITGKRKILKFEGHYHGWYDNILVDVRTTARRGQDFAPVRLSEGQLGSVLDELVICPWNDLNRLQDILEQDPDIAAVISEPIMCNNSCILPNSSYLTDLHKLCRHFGILLIFDEVITGFRVALGGAQEYLSATADLAVYGKAMASGFPISALAGKKEYMDYLSDGRVVHAGTLNTNISCVAAALATVEILIRDGHKIYPRIRDLGQRLMVGLRESARTHGLPLLVQGPGPMFHSGFTEMEAVNSFRHCRSYNAVQQEALAFGLLQRGIRLIGRGLWYVSAVHAEQDVEETLKIADQVFREMKRV